MGLSLLSCAAPINSSNSDSNQNNITVLYLSLSSAGSSLAASFIPNLEAPLTVAELMMDHPAHFVCSPPMPMPMPNTPRHAQIINAPSTCSNPTRRISAIPADVELKPNSLYVLLPMHKLNGRFSEAEKSACLAAFVSQLQPGMAAGLGVNTTIRSGYVAKRLKSAIAIIQHLKLLRRQSATYSSNKVTPLITPNFDATRSPAGKDVVIAANVSVLSTPMGAGQMLATTTTHLCNPWTPKLDTIVEVHSF